MAKNEKAPSSEENKNNADTRGLEILGSILKDNLPSLLKYLDDQKTKHVTPITKFTISSFLIIISIIIIGTGILVFSKLLDSSAFTFIIGTILGYLFGISKIVLEKKEE